MTVFEKIKEAEPKHLYLYCDGPRLKIATDKEKCNELKQLVLNSISWDCDVKTFFPNENSGPGLGVYSAIRWFFSNVPEGIVLEHDVMPSSEFFVYCSALLEKYRENPKVGFITGSSFTNRFQQSKFSYGFSYLPHIWGWASWRRSMDGYTFDLNSSDKNIKKLFSNGNLFKSKGLEIHLRYMYFLLRYKLINTWDLQLMYNLLSKGQLTIFPHRNLVSNIGFGPEAVHCTDPTSPLANMPIGILGPLVHPIDLTASFDNDVDYYNKFQQKSSARLFFSVIKHLIKKILS